MEFVAHIRNSQELQTLYESVQSDTSTGAPNDVPMNIEWPLRFRFSPWW